MPGIEPEHFIEINTFKSSSHVAAQLKLQTA